MTDSRFQLAQVNIGRARGEMSDPVMAEFVAHLPEINALADQSPGFVWRLQTEDGDATAVRPYEDTRILINLSVWADLPALRTYVYRSAHAAIMRRRREWFERFDRIYVALWWVPAGHRPPVAEAVARLAHLEQHGPTAVAFGFAEPFGPDGLPMPREGVTRDDTCPATQPANEAHRPERAPTPAQVAPSLCSCLSPRPALLGGDWGWAARWGVTRWSSENLYAVSPF